jgi:hypothetical protein
MQLDHRHARGWLRPDARKGGREIGRRDLLLGAHGAEGVGGIVD